MSKKWQYLLLATVVAIAIYYGIKVYRYSMERKDSPFKYFAWSEFDSPDQPGSGRTHMNRAFVEKLDAIRAEVGFPLIVTSGYRTRAHNEKVGGVADSSHTKGLAVDLAAPTESAKHAIARAAIKNGISRIGWGRTFIHLDVDPQKTQGVVWGYGNTYPSFNSLTQNLA